MNKIRRSCFLVLGSPFIPSAPRLFQNSRAKWTRLAQAWPPSSERAFGENRAPFTERQSGADVAPTVPSRGGVPREGGPWIAQGACRDPGRGSSPGPAPDPRAAEALAYLPAGTRCADNSAPAPASSSWAQLRPAWSSCGQFRLEMICRHRRDRKASGARVTLGHSPGARRAPSPKRLETEGGLWGGGLLASSPGRGSRRNQAGKPRSPGSRAQGGKVYWESGRVAPRLGRWGGVSAPRQAREGGGARSTAGRSLFLS